MQAAALVTGIFLWQSCRCHTPQLLVGGVSDLIQRIACRRPVSLVTSILSMPWPAPIPIGERSHCHISVDLQTNVNIRLRLFVFAPCRELRRPCHPARHVFRVSLLQLRCLVMHETRRLSPCACEDQTDSSFGATCCSKRMSIRPPPTQPSSFLIPNSSLSSLRFFASHLTASHRTAAAPFSSRERLKLVGGPEPAAGEAWCRLARRVADGRMRWWDMFQV